MNAIPLELAASIFNQYKTSDKRAYELLYMNDCEMKLCRKLLAVAKKDDSWLVK